MVDLYLYGVGCDSYITFKGNHLYENILNSFEPEDLLDDGLVFPEECNIRYRNELNRSDLYAITYSDDYGNMYAHLNVTLNDINEIAGQLNEEDYEGHDDYEAITVFKMEYGINIHKYLFDNDKIDIDEYNRRITKTMEDNMNLFELLKHEKHDLVTTIDGDRVVTGCLNCGIELISSAYMDDTYGKFIDLMPTLIEHERVNLIGEIKKFEDKTLKFIYDKSLSFYESNLLDRIDCCIQDEMDNYDEVNQHYACISLSEDIFDCIYGDTRVLCITESPYFDRTMKQRFINEYMQDLYELVIRYSKHERYEIVVHEEPRTMAYYTYKPDTYSFYVFEKETVSFIKKKAETPTKIISFRDETEFAKYLCDSSNRDEIEYRVENGLIEVHAIDFLEVSNIFRYKTNAAQLYHNFIRILSSSY